MQHSNTSETAGNRNILLEDQLGRIVELAGFPERIVSLVPSQTEFLVDIGLKKNLVGITKFCIHPRDVFNSVCRVGGTKNINIEKIKQLNPDLIICNKEENQKEQVETLSRHFPVYVSDVENLDQAYHMMISIGRLTNRESKALSLVEKIKEQFCFSDQVIEKKLVLNAVYLIWKDPYMAAGKENIINCLLKKAGFNNLLENNDDRYPAVSIESLQKLAPEVVLLSSEPYPFKQKHREELETLLSSSRIILVDGECFSWYGSRLLKSPQYFTELREKLENL